MIVSLTRNSVLPYARRFNCVSISATFSAFLTLTFSAEQIARSAMFVPLYLSDGVLIRAAYVV